MMPYWPVPPPMAGPATGVNMGMDYWGTPTSVPMHNKVIAAPASAPSSNSRDVVLSDPAIQDERELKRQKRKQSNRESARRSRLRKQVCSFCTSLHGFGCRLLFLLSLGSLCFCKQLIHKRPTWIQPNQQ
jgi:hypothetical protein